MYARYRYAVNHVVNIRSIKFLSRGVLYCYLYLRVLSITTRDCIPFYRLAFSLVTWNSRDTPHPPFGHRIEFRNRDGRSRQCDETFSEHLMTQDWRNPSLDNVNSYILTFQFHRSSNINNTSRMLAVCFPAFSTHCERRSRSLLIVSSD